MAYFTVWRIHECNANFLKTFLGDKARTVFWLTAFFLIFWVRNGAGPEAADPNDAEAVANAIAQNRMLTISALGAFLLLIETAYIANRLLGRTAELLSGWLLLLFPGFLLYARFGVYQPCAAACACAAILLGCRGQMTFGRMLLAGILCAVSTLCYSALGGLLMPVICIWLLRCVTGEDTGTGRKIWGICGFLPGAAGIVLPMLFPMPGKEAAFSLMDWYSLFVQGLRGRNEDLRALIVLAAVVPWFWLTLPALEALNKRLKVIGPSSNKRTLCVLAVGLAVFMGVIDFGLGFLLPFMAVACAWFALRPEGSASVWAGRILNGAGLFWSWLFPLLCFAAPFWFVYVYYRPEMAFTNRQVAYVYFQIPLAGVAACAGTLLAYWRKKRGNAAYFPETGGWLDRFVFILVPVLFLLMP